MKLYHGSSRIIEKPEYGRGTQLAGTGRAFRRPSPHNPAV